MKIELLKYPTENDWMEVKRRALVTVGKTPINPPTTEWKKRILAARHSPIRYLTFSFYFHNIPSWVSVHFVCHVHAQPYVKSQRNDRQSDYDRTKAQQDTPVDMILDVNAEELMVMANKRLCNQAANETRHTMQQMCVLAIDVCPEIKDFLVPMCVRNNGICYEMYSCKKDG